MHPALTKRYAVPNWHYDTIQKESDCVEPESRMLDVVRAMADQEAPDFSSVDWDKELQAFGEVEFPAYYRQPFHSVPGGYLSQAAAIGDRCAMEAIYRDDHPQRSLGLREALATLVPEDAGTVADLGCGSGDGAAAIARRLPGAQVTAIDASPFMLIAARHQNPDLPNLAFEQGFAEQTRFETASQDAVTITLVFHECPDEIKRTILGEAHRILRPGGALALSDTAQTDLDTYRGFYEPYKEQWLAFDPAAFLRDAGFETVASNDVAPPLWTFTARKPA